MDILVIGSESQLEEVRSKFGASHTYVLKRDVISDIAAIEKSSVVFDFVSPYDTAQLAGHQGTTPVFFDTSTVRLSPLFMGFPIYGFCGLPTFVNRPLFEVICFEEDREELERICNELGTAFQIVEDRVGMVTPRIICMIINEAYCTVEEGTATREDIDLAMKLGTNYPFGPFEWCRKIGLGNVVRVLKAVKKDTGDERYQVCRLLETEGLAGKA